MTNGQEFLIAAAGPEHAPAVAGIEKESFAHPWSEKAITDELQREDSVFLVCLYGDTVCGYVNCRNVCGEGYIGNLAVKKDFQRKGLGKLLLRALTQTAKKEKMDFLTLEVRKSNLPALRLYEACGFMKVGERKGFYTAPAEDAALLTLYLKNESE